MPCSSEVDTPELLTEFKLLLFRLWVATLTSAPPMSTELALMPLFAWAWSVTLMFAIRPMCDLSELQICSDELSIGIGNSSFRAV